MKELLWIARFIRDFLMAGPERRRFERELAKLLAEQDKP